MQPILLPSMMCIDFLNFSEQLRTIDKRAAILHLDIMDGMFAKNITVTPDLVRAFKKITAKPMEAHLMTQEPERWIDTFAEIGVAEITLHRETIDTNAFRLIDRIRSLGISPGIALCPATSVAQCEDLLPVIDHLLIMSVDIGYAGQPFIPQTLAKVERARNIRGAHGYSYLIQVDGGCGRNTFESLRRAGTDRFVVGNALFGKKIPLDIAFDEINAEFLSATGESTGA
ncbi:allulose-6-phosphate 3-epimerase [Clostridia bacterium]|nr:allulose-6-phosphate 3-epimerase [Clostridia bacterium]